MRRKAAIAPILALAASLLGSSSARADLFLTLSPTTATIAIGEEVWVDVVLSQDATGPQVDAANPLFTAGFAVVLGSSSVAYLEAAVGLDWISDVAYDPGTSTLTVGLTNVIGVEDLSTPVVLASLRLKGASFGSTTLVLTELDPGSIDFLTLSGEVADPTGAATSAITVTGVPEPSSLALATLGVAAAGLAASRRRVV